MTIFNDAYDTTAGGIIAHENLKKIKHAILETITRDGRGWRSLNVRSCEDVQALFLTGACNSEQNIPLFTHPIYFFTDSGEKTIVTDIRLFVKKDAVSGDYSNDDSMTIANRIVSNIRDLSSYNFCKSRAILNMLWVTGQQVKIRNNLSFAGAVYSVLLSDTIARSHALDYKDQTLINILACYFYLWCFEHEDAEVDEQLIQRMAIQINRLLKIPSEMSFQVIDKVQKLNSIEDFCEAVPKVIQSERIKNFNLGALLTVVKNIWYGTNAKENIQVALEHPPTWCSIVYSALSDRTYKNSMVAQVAERIGKRGVSEEYVKNFEMTVKQLIDTEDRSGQLRYFE